MINPPASNANYGPETDHASSGVNRQPPREKRYQFHQPEYLPRPDQTSPRHRPGKPQTRFPRDQIYKQIESLHTLGRTANAEHKFTLEEFNDKEHFRQILEQIARHAVGANYPGLPVDQLHLRCYGSIANGFALKNCDMDLMLSLPEYKDLEAAGVIPSSDGTGEQQFKADIQRILEKAFLDHGYGSRLIAQTRVPILKLCQTPPPWLMQNLQAERAKWEKSVKDAIRLKLTPWPPKFAEGELDPEIKKILDMDLNEAEAEPEPEAEAESDAERERRKSIQDQAAEIHRSSPLDFTDDCGIQCDINLSNFVALENSHLLRTYARFDQRVKDLGTFVKIWAKARDINCPYRGTLSSYGYILMVLHYLMNVAKPPVIPNLQYVITCDDSWHPDRPIPLVDGFDVRFVQHPQAIQQLHEEMASMKNKESFGSLLRGFFMYYGTHQGFHWMRDVISIRTNGGIVDKKSKGWTATGFEQGETKGVRVRYIVAIEDPFEIEHNIGRTVGHTGVVRIRNEFRRAWDIIEKLGTEKPPRADQIIYLVPPENRIDTLKIDLDNRKKRQVRMRLELEIKEKGLLYTEERKADEPETTPGRCPDSEKGSSQSPSSPKSSPSSPGSKLTSSPSTQDQEPQVVWLPPGRWRRRGCIVEKEDEAKPDEEPVNKVNNINTGIPVLEEKVESSVGEMTSQPEESDVGFSDQTISINDDPTEDAPHQRVPSTLYPGVDRSARPRDEDPEIMPIPRRFGFSFDLQQMEDLTVISQGGNGCARGGAEFNIEEEEYEWGGGGMMGHPLSQTSSKLVHSGSYPPSYEFGKGDEEGYLNELPTLST